MSNRLLVLMIDDSEPDLLLAREVFDEHRDHVQVVMKTSGAEALHYLRNLKNTTPDVIVTDLNMPGLTGLELIRALKDDPRLRLIPVVVLTTSNQATDIEQAYSLHASSYLVKASDFGSFVEQIEHFLAFWKSVKTFQRP